MTMQQPPDKGNTFFKFMFVALCCAAGARFASQWHAINRDENNPIPDVPISFALFAVLLFVSLWLGGRGKASESWAFLAYSSWMTMPGIMLIHNALLYRQMAGSDWIIYFLGLGVCALFVRGGVRAALRGSWGAVVCWWLGSIICICSFFLFCVMRNID